MSFEIVLAIEAGHAVGERAGEQRPRIPVATDLQVPVETAQVAVTLATSAPEAPGFTCPPSCRSVAAGIRLTTPVVG